MKKYIFLFLFLLVNSVNAQRIISHENGITFNTGSSNVAIGGNLTVATNVTVGGVVNGAGTATLTNFIAVAANNTLNGYPSVALVSGATDQTGIDVSGTTSSWKFNGARYYRFATSGFYPNDANASYTLGIGVRPWSYLYANTNYAIGFYTDASNYARSSLSHDGTSTTTLAGETSGTGTDAQSLKIKLAGNGALYVEGDTAGNARGNSAVDLQVYRTAATQVASATGSVVAGGYENTASANLATVSGGQNNTASATRATVVGGNNNTASGSYSTVVGGFNGSAYRYGQVANASGVFSASGDAQYSRLVARNTTSGTTPAELFLNGSSDRAVLPANTSWGFTVNVVGRTTDGGSGAEQSGYYEIKGLIRRDGANNTVLVGYITKTTIAEDDATWDVTASADDTNEALNINCTGGSGDTVRWVATINLTEVGG